MMEPGRSGGTQNSEQAIRSGQWPSRGLRLPLLFLPLLALSGCFSQYDVRPDIGQTQASAQLDTSAGATRAPGKPVAPPGSTATPGRTTATDTAQTPPAGAATTSATAVNPADTPTGGSGFWSGLLRAFSATRATPAAAKPGPAAQPVAAPASPPPQTAQTASAPARPAPPSPPPPAKSLWTRLIRDFKLSKIRNPRIQAEIRRLQRHPAAFEVLVNRSEPYLYHIVKEVEKRHMPGELALLPAVESGFRPYAYSPDGAVGLWQFMPGTGRFLGLKQDWWYDGRRDVLRGTEVALDYLQSLDRRYDGDWLKALAAYNAGDGTVNRAVRLARRRHRPTDYWHLDLPGETDLYVPRLLAIAAIVADPKRYGMTLPDLANKPYFKPVACHGQIDLKVAANLAQIPTEDLLALNPGYRRWATSPNGPHKLLLPLDKVQQFRIALAHLPEDKRVRWKRHKVVRGDALASIARHYKVSVNAIKEANGLHSNLIRIGRNLLIPLSGSVALSARNVRLGIPRERLRYQVRGGDSLYTIAHRFGVKIDDLKRWNQIGRYLHPGQNLTVYVDPNAESL